MFSQVESRAHKNGFQTSFLGYTWVTQALALALISISKFLILGMLKCNLSGLRTRLEHPPCNFLSWNALPPMVRESGDINFSLLNRLLKCV